MVAVVLLLAAGMFTYFGDFSRAADPETMPTFVLKDSYGRVIKDSETVTMEAESLILNLQTEDGTINTDKYDVEWTILGTGVQNIEFDGTTSSNFTKVITAKQAGQATISVTITDKATKEMANLNCNISVLYSIRSDDTANFFQIQNSDVKKSLVLSPSQSYNLKLSFGEADQWTADNDEIISVDQTGKVTAVGAGKTQVRASRTNNGQTQTAVMDVYVMPGLSAEKTTTNAQYKQLLKVTLESGQSIYTNTDFSKGSTLSSKIIWKIKKQNDKGELVDVTEDHIKLVQDTTGSNALQVRGLAGNYLVTFYTVGTTFKNGDNMYDSNIAENKAPTTMELTIKSVMKSTEETINIGDTYDYAESYNMTEEDFCRYFTVKYNVLESTGEIASNFMSFSSSTSKVTALKEGTVKATIHPIETQITEIAKLLGLPEGTNYIPDVDVTFHILDRVTLNATVLTISVGQEYQLTPRLDAAYDKTAISWETSDDKKVSVTEDGLIKGLSVTGSQAVTITFTLNKGNGIYRTATCLVTVEAAVDSFTLSPSKDQTMLAGDHLVIKAELKQAVTVAPLEWLSTDEEVFTVESAADGKTATITAVGGGKADLMVYNTVNKQYKVIHITVRIAIQSITFENSSISQPLYLKGYNLHDEVTYEPADATDSKLVWNSNNTGVVEVSKDGYLTFVGAGTALIQVTPEYNPYNVMATCVVNIQGTPTDMTISQSDVVVNVGESVNLDVTYTPLNTTTELTWTPNDKEIVKIEFNREKQIATLTGLKAGNTSVNVVSKEGMIANVNVTVRHGSTGIVINEKDVVLITGQTQQLTTTITPADSTDILKWESDDEKIVTVDENGMITAVAPGSTYVFVLAYNGSLQTCFARVAVTVRDAVSAIRLPQSEYDMMVGETLTISPIIEPATAYEQKVIWELSSSDIAELSEVKGSNSDINVKALDAGTVMLTGTTEDGGYSVSCLIRIESTETPAPSGEPGADSSAGPSVEPTATPTVVPTKVKVTPSTKFLKVGKSFYVKAKVTGTTKNKKVKWKSSNKKICTVSQSGKVKGKKIGSATITATAADGSGAKGKCKVRVVRQVTKITMKPSTAKVLVGSVKKLKVTIKPKNATIKKVSWSTSDASIATVDSSGKVLGIAPGVVQIRAKAKDGSGKTARCYVTVKEAVEATSVTVANSELTVAKGRAVQSGIVASPVNTTTSIRYYSDNKKVASVDSKGKIKTYRVGQATIYGETANGLTGYCDVLVVDLNRKGIVMRQYDTEQLQVNEISSGVTWYSKDINIATVDSSGLVTGRKKGTTIVYANVNGVKLGCRVKVKKIK